jgi:acyl-coenzyme A synthetase/AMP-(fatty) acid ligase
MLISRNIIRKDIVYKDDENAFDNISKLTVQFKNMLFDAGATKGDLVTLGIIYVSEQHISALMACAELGLRVILLDAPATKQSLKYTKLAIHGPADFCIDDDKGTRLYGGLHQKMIETYSKKVLKCQALEMYEDAEDFSPGYDITEDDPFIVSSTSGSTRQSRMVEFSHKECYEISKRAIDIFRFTSDSKVLHTRNLHHASALFTHLFPALMTCKTHYYRPIPDKLSFEVNDSTGLNALIFRDGYTHLMVSNEDMLKWFFENTRRTFKQRLLINMSGFTLDRKYTNWAKKYNVEFISHYGSIDTAIPLLVNRVTPQTKPDEIGDGYLGKAPDKYYSITLNSGEPRIMCPLWSEPRKMDDVLRYDNDTGKFYHVGRTANEQIEWYLNEAKRLNVNMDKFFQDTKINMEQLRGHIHEIKKVKKS